MRSGKARIKKLDLLKDAGSEVNQPIMTNGFQISRLLLFPADQSIFQVLLNFSSMYNGWYHLLTNATIF